MVKLVGNYGVLLVEQWFKNPSVRVESGNIKNCVFCSEKGRQLSLKLFVNVLRAADKTYAAHAISPLVHVFSGRFANPAFDPVANHGAAQGARTGEPDLGASISIISQAECGKQRPGELGAMIVYSAEILGAQDSRALRKASDSATSRR